MPYVQSPKELDVPGKAYIDLEKLLKQFFSLESISVLDAATNPRTQSQKPGRKVWSRE